MMEDNNVPNQQPEMNQVEVPRTEPVQPVQMMQPAESAQEILIEDRIFATLSYISILFIVPLILKNENEDIHFHAKQGMALFGAEVVVWFALFLLDTFLAVVFPAAEIFLVRVLGAAAWIIFVALSFAGIYMAATGKRWHMPLIGRLAVRFRI